MLIEGIVITNFKVKKEVNILRSFFVRFLFFDLIVQDLLMALPPSM